MTPRPGGWVVVADSPFLPPRGGGEREHAGFVGAAVRAGLVSALVVPYSPDEAPWATSPPPCVPVLGAPRDLRRRHLLAPRTPFVVASRPAPANLVERVRELVPTPRGVVLFSYKSHEIGRRLAEGLQVPAVLRQHNLEGHYHRELARGTGGPRGWLLRWEAARIERDERRLEQAPWLRGIAEISALDAVTRARRTSTPVLHVPPFATDGVPGGRRTPEPGTVLFLGALDVATNHDGLRWFVAQVWPTVRRRAPAARLMVVGSRPSPGLLRMLAAVDGVEVHADVPDVAPFLAGAAVAVNPTVSGSGVNIKLVDYLLGAVPTVTTADAAAALALTAGRDVDVAADAEAFAAQVTRLLAEPDRAAEIARTRAADLRHRLDPAGGLELVEQLLTGGS